MKKFPVLTLITLLASSGGKAVCRDGIFFFPKTKMAITISKIHRGISSNTIRAKKSLSNMLRKQNGIEMFGEINGMIAKMCLHRRIKVGGGGRNKLLPATVSDVFGSRNDF